MVFSKRKFILFSHDRQALLDLRSTVTNLDFDFKYDFNSDLAVPLFIPDPIPCSVGYQKAASVDMGDEVESW